MGVALVIYMAILKVGVEFAVCVKQPKDTFYTDYNVPSLGKDQLHSVQD